MAKWEGTYNIEITGRNVVRILIHRQSYTGTIRGASPNLERTAQQDSVVYYFYNLHAAQVTFILNISVVD
jgi:hypothetical protein